MYFIFDYVHIKMSYIREFKARTQIKNMYIYKNTNTEKDLIIIKIGIKMYFYY